MNPLLICLLGVGLFVGSIVAGPQQDELAFNQFHHEYIGVAACSIGAVMHSKFLTTIGAYIALDDGLQHGIQRLGNDPLYRSPLNYGYRLTLGKVIPIQKLNRWLDRILN